MSPDLTGVRAARKWRLWKAAAVVLGGLLISLLLGYFGHAIEVRLGVFTFGDPVSVRSTGGVIRGPLHLEATNVRVALGSLPPPLERGEALAAFHADWRDSFVDHVVETRKAEAARKDQPQLLLGSFALQAGDVYTTSIATVVAAGWPLPCLYGTKVIVSSIDDKGLPLTRPPVGTRMDGMFEPAVRMWEQNVYYPYRPLLLPLLFNTAFFSGVIALVWWAPGAVRREVRRARVCCLACGYQLRSRVAKCPECGRAG